MTWKIDLKTEQIQVICGKKLILKVDLGEFYQEIRLFCHEFTIEIHHSYFLPASY